MRSKSTVAFLFVIFAGLLSVPAITAQTPTPKPTEEDVIKVSSRLVAIPVSVTTADGQAVQGLTAKDFRILEEGRAQKVEKVGTADAVPLEIVLLFDVSASTDAMFKFEQDTAAKFIQDVVRPNDRAAVFTVGEKAVLIQPRDTGDKAIAAIRAITPTKEYTAFYDSVSAAARYLRQNAPENTRRVIVVISDGEDTNSERIANAIQNGYKTLGQKINTMDNKTLLQYTVTARNEASMAERARVGHELQDADSVFFSINPAGSSYQLNKMSTFGQENMQQFADQTGGSAFLPKFAPVDLKDEYQNASNMKRNQEVLETIFRQLANDLRAQYLVQYYSETEYPLGKFVKLDVGLQNSAGRRVRARQGYYAKPQ